MHPNEPPLLDKLEFARWMEEAHRLTVRHVEALCKQFDRQLWEARHVQAAPLE